MPSRKNILNDITESRINARRADFKLDDHPAKDDYTAMPFRWVPLDDIQPDPNQPRQHFDKESLKELSESIKQKGVLQPIIVRMDKANKIWLIAGERR